MIMPRGQQLLLPVNPGFITASLLLALAINLLPLGPMVWMPDALILALAFWGVHQPWRVGMGIGFVLGLCMDVHQSSLLGQHALAYTVLMYGTRVFHRRVLWLRPLQQPWQMVGLFAAAHAAYDRVWELPLWEDYQEGLDSNFADMANVAGNRDGGAIIGACFLSRF